MLKTDSVMNEQGLVKGYRVFFFENEFSCATILTYAMVTSLIDDGGHC